MPASLARNRTARPMNSLTAAAETRVTGSAASTCSAASLSDWKVSLPPRKWWYMRATFGVLLSSPSAGPPVASRSTKKPYREAIA